jgi:hypothetical protein
MATNKTTIDEFVTRVKNNTPLVYEKGKTEGVEEGLDTAINAQEEFLENQPQTYYDTFWDALQKKGQPTNYQYVFAFNRFYSDDIDAYNPKYDIKIYDNVTTAGTYTFAQSTRLIDTKVVIYANNHSIAGMFSGAKNLKTIRKLVINPKTVVTNVFDNCSALEELNVEGTIGQNGFDVHWSTLLNKASIESIINALSTTTEGLTVTLSQTAVDTAFETVKGAADGSTSAEWIALAGDENTEGIRPKWNISLM